MRSDFSLKSYQVGDRGGKDVACEVQCTDKRPNLYGGLFINLWSFYFFFCFFLFEAHHVVIRWPPDTSPFYYCFRSKPVDRCCF